MKGKYEIFEWTNELIKESINILYCNCGLVHSVDKDIISGDFSGYIKNPVRHSYVHAPVMHLNVLLVFQGSISWMAHSELTCR